MRHFDMKTDWNLRAEENAHKAIACDEAENEAVFRASGERDLRLVLEGVPEILPANDSALEIGCGTGRLLEPLSRHFGHVFGVDVSGEMIRRGRQRLSHLPQVHFTEIDGLGELPFKGGSFNFCFSYITFHHIPLKAVASPLHRRDSASPRTGRSRPATFLWPARRLPLFHPGTVHAQGHLEGLQVHPARDQRRHPRRGLGDCSHRLRPGAVPPLLRQDAAGHHLDHRAQARRFLVPGTLIGCSSLGARHAKLPLRRIAKVLARARHRVSSECAGRPIVACNRSLVTIL